MNRKMNYRRAVRQIQAFRAGMWVSCMVFTVTSLTLAIDHPWQTLCIVVAAISVLTAWVVHRTMLLNGALDAYRQGKTPSPIYKQVKGNWWILWGYGVSQESRA